MRHDKEAKNLFEIIRNGWPDQKKKLPDNITSYFSFRDTFSSEKNFILKGDVYLFRKNVVVFSKINNIKFMWVTQV